MSLITIYEDSVVEDTRGDNDILYIHFLSQLGLKEFPDKFTFKTRDKKYLIIWYKCNEYNSETYINKEPADMKYYSRDNVFCFLLIND